MFVNCKNNGIYGNFRDLVYLFMNYQNYFIFFNFSFKYFKIKGHVLIDKQTVVNGKSKLGLHCNSMR
ncbi:hypothetical protein A4G19_05545 [Pasteurellaceae bacterium Macca]|nr:hypothetical protein [Pasteurellaceae bacterium Macca]